MAKNQSDEVRKELIVKVITRAWKDPEFKKQLLANPGAALTEMHVPIPEGKQVRVYEEGQHYSKDDKFFTIILPKHPTEAHKMSEKELANVAGASCSDSWDVDGLRI
jgi:hypothetical protein